VVSQPPSDEIQVLLGERPGRARELSAPPRPHAPGQHHRPPEARHVDQPDLAPPVAVSDDTTRPTALDHGRCLNHHPDAITMVGDLDDVEGVHADEDIATLAIGLAGGRIWHERA
jgi:hypothetical protein